LAVRQGARGASGHAGEAERASFDIDREPAEGGIGRERDSGDGRRGGEMQLRHGVAQHTPLLAEGQEGGGLPRRKRSVDAAERGEQRIWIVRFDQRTALRAVAEAVSQIAGDGDRMRQPRLIVLRLRPAERTDGGSAPSEGRRPSLYTQL